MYIRANKICIIFDNAFSDISLFLVVLVVTVAVAVAGVLFVAGLSARLRTTTLANLAFSLWHEAALQETRSYPRRHVSINFASSPSPILSPCGKNKNAKGHEQYVPAPDSLSGNTNA